MMPLPYGRPLVGLSKKPGGDLDGEALDALDVGRLDVDLAVVFGDSRRRSPGVRYGLPFG